MIRRADITDLDLVSNLRYRMYKDNGTAHLLIDNFVLKTLSFYHQLYEADKCIHLVKEIDGDVVGCAGAVIREDVSDPFFRKHTCGCITDVFIEEPYHGHGFAEAMIGELLSWLELKNVDTVTMAPSHYSISSFPELRSVRTEVRLPILQN